MVSGMSRRLPHGSLQETPLGNFQPIQSTCSELSLCNQQSKDLGETEGHHTAPQSSAQPVTRCSGCREADDRDPVGDVGHIRVGRGEEQGGSIQKERGGLRDALIGRQGNDRVQGRRRFSRTGQGMEGGPYAAPQRVSCPAELEEEDQAQLSAFTNSGNG